METEKINAIATSIVAFVTVIGLMIGFYYNAKSFNSGIYTIILFELIFVIVILIFILWVERKMKNVI